MSTLTLYKVINPIVRGLLRSPLHGRTGKAPLRGPSDACSSG